MEKVNPQEVFNLIEKGNYRDGFDLLFDYFDLYAFETVETVLGQFQVETALQPIAEMWEQHGNNKVIDLAQPASIQKLRDVRKEIEGSIPVNTPGRDAEVQKKLDGLVYEEFTKAFLIFRLVLLSMRYQFYRTGAESAFLELQDIEQILSDGLAALIAALENRTHVSVREYIEAEYSSLLLHSYLTACFYYSHFRDFDQVEDYAQAVENLLSHIPVQDRSRYRIRIDLYLAESEVHDGVPDEALDMLYRLNSDDEVIADPYCHSEVMYLLAETLIEYFAFRSGALEEAKTLLTDAGKMKSELGDRVGLVRLYQQVGNLFSMRGDTETALTYLKKGKESIERMQIPAHLPELLYALTENLTSMREVDQAKALLAHADKVYGGELFEGQLHYLSGVIDFIELQDNDSIEYYSSISNLEQAIEIFEECDYEEGIAKANLLLAQLYLYDVKDVSIFELEEEENYLFYIYKLQEAANIFLRNNRYSELLNAYFLMGEIYYLKSSQHKAEEVWQFLCVYAQQVDRAIDASETDFAGCYLKKIRRFLPDFTAPVNKTSAVTEKLTTSTLTEESILITVRCENVEQVFEAKGAEAFGTLVKNLEKACVLIENNLSGSVYINNDFVDYHFFIPYTGKDTIDTALGLSAFLYVVFSHFYEVKLSIYSGPASIELELPDEQELFKHALYHRGMEKSRDIFPALAAEHLLVGTDIMKNSALFRSTGQAPSDDRKYYQNLRDLQEKRDRYQGLFTDMLAEIQHKDPTKTQRLSVKIENYIRNQADPLYTTKQEQQKRLNNEGYFKDLQYSLQQAGIEFDFATAIKLHLQVVQLSRAIHRFEKGSPRNLARKKNLEKALSEITHSFAQSGGEAAGKRDMDHPLKSHTLSWQYLCPHCGQEYVQKEADSVLGQACSACEEKIDSFEEISLDLHKEIRDLIHIYSVSYHRFSEDIEKMDRLFPFLNTNSYKKNTRIKLYNHERKMSYMPKLKRTKDRHDVHTAALRHIKLKQDLHAQSDPDRRN